MISDLANIFLRTIPPAFEAGVKSGEFGIYGSVIRSVANGQIVAHLQETSGLASLAGRLLVPGGVPTEAAKLATGVIGDGLILKQGQQIKAAVNLLSHTQMATLLTSGATLGVSVVGFAVLAAKITRLEKQIASFDQSLVDLKHSIDALREDRIAQDLSWLRTTLQQMEESWTLRSPNAQLERVAGDSHILANRFFDRAVAVLNSDGPHLLEASSFLEAVGIAQSARVAARLAADENEAARCATVEALDQYDVLLDQLNAADQALRCVADNDDEAVGPSWASRLEGAMGSTRAVTAGVRQRAEAMAASEELLGTLNQRAIGGRQFLSAARKETEAPFLIVTAK